MSVYNPIITREAVEEDHVLQGLYSPSLGQVACVIIGAAFGCDKRITTIFHAEDWFVSPVDDMMMIRAPMSQWKQIADMPRAERPGPEHFARMREARNG